MKTNHFFSVKLFFVSLSIFTGLLMSCQQEKSTTLVHLSKSRLTKGVWHLDKGYVRYFGVSYKVPMSDPEMSITHTNDFEIKSDKTFTDYTMMHGSDGQFTTTIKGTWEYINYSACAPGKEKIRLTYTSYSESGEGTCNCTRTQHSTQEIAIDKIKKDELHLQYLDCECRVDATMQYKR